MPLKIAPEMARDRSSQTFEFVLEQSPICLLHGQCNLRLTPTPEIALSGAKRHRAHIEFASLICPLFLRLL